MKIILLIPIIVYLCLMLVNLDLLRDFQTINIFGVQDLEIPLFLFSSSFIVVYAVIVYIVYSGVNSYLAHKVKKLDRQIVELKSELYNNQKDLLENIQAGYKLQLESFKQDNDKKMETLIKYNQYTLEKVLEETGASFAKYRKETQRLLASGEGTDKILKKLRFWEK